LKRGLWVGEEVIQLRVKAGGARMSKSNVRLIVFQCRFWVSASRGAMPSHLITYGHSFCPSVCPSISMYSLRPDVALQMDGRNDYPYVMREHGPPPLGAGAPFPPLVILSTEMGHREPMTTIALKTFMV
jgi:hypothetical protein